MARIAIVGGGPGGLLTAHLTARKHGQRHSTTIFEAASALGGKLVTRTFAAAPVAYESGTAEIYGYGGAADDPLRRLLDELDIVTKPMSGHTVVLDGTVLRDEADIARHWGGATARAIVDFKREATRLLPRECFHPACHLDDAHPWARRTCAELLDVVQDPVARKYLSVSAHADLATEPHLTNGLNGLRNFVKDIPGYITFHAVEGGMSRLAAGLVQKTRDAEAITNARVARIERTPRGSWRVVSTSDFEWRSHEFDVVILALPANQLGAIEYAGEPLRGVMSEHVASFDHPGHYLRVSLLFRSPFWRGRIDGSWFTVDAFGGACVYDESARFDAAGYGVLGYLIAGNDASVLVNADEPTLVRRVLEALPPDLREKGRESLIEARVHRWCGGISGQPGGLPARDPRITHQPDPDRLRGLLLVGDYLFDSTLNGVYASAELATTLLSSHLRLADRRLGHPSGASASAEWNRRAESWPSAERRPPSTSAR